MARANHVIELKQGEKKVPITMTFTDDTGKLVDLSGWTARLLAGKKNQTRIIDAAATVNGDQLNYRGQATYITADADSLNALGNYEVEGVASHPDGRVFKYPKTLDESFCTLKIVRSK